MFSEMIKLLTPPSLAHSDLLIRSENPSLANLLIVSVKIRSAVI